MSELITPFSVIPQAPSETVKNCVRFSYLMVRKEVLFLAGGCLVFISSQFCFGEKGVI